MHRRRFALVAIVGLLLIGVIGMAFPGSAGAAIDSYQWAETAYTGWDNFYGADVYAYEAGSTAKLTVKVENDVMSHRDINIKEAKIEFDWGQEYAATVSPTEIRYGEYGLLNFEFEVPSTDVASNKVLHSYTILVGYQERGVNYVRNWVANTFIGSGDGSTEDFSFGTSPVVGDSLALWFRDTTVSPNTITPVPSDAYDFEEQEFGTWATVSFDTAPAAGIDIYANYQYSEMVGTGNNYNTVFYLPARPVLPGSLHLFLVNTVTQAVSEVATTAYAFAAETGEITMATAPTSNERVYAAYEYYNRWPAAGGSDFAVYSADQADARELREMYNDMGRTYIFLPSSEGMELAQEAHVLDELGDTAYQNGNFTAAKDYYQQAVDTLEAAIEADTAVNVSIEDFLTGIGSGAASWIDSQAAKGDAEAAKLQAEADRINALTDAEVDKVEAEAGFANLYGIFLVLIGVTGLLGGIGGILWAGSRLIAARRM